MTGEDIRAYRKQNGLTQTEFGALVERSKNTISDWETGLHPIPGRQMARLREIMGIEEPLPEAVPTMPEPVDLQAAKRCKKCPYWRHMDNRNSVTRYCAYLVETGRERTCGVEHTYQRYKEMSPLSLDAARAAELGMSYGQYKARGAMT